MELPTPNPSQSYVQVSVLEGGYIHVPESYAVEGGSPTKPNVLPSMAFLLHHVQNGKRIVFDLGIRKDWENYPPSVVQMIKQVLHVQVPLDVTESLRRGGMEPHEVDTIILSHVHFDHVGDPAFFPSAQFVVGGESKQLFEANDTEPLPPARDLLPESRTSFLPIDDWKPIGPFPRAFDFLGDGSVYLVDAPGHLPGHMNVLARTSADGSWIFLAGDSAHDVRLITGEKEIGIIDDPAGRMTCMHKDIVKAKEHIERIKQIKALPKVHVLLAHDVGWYEENRSKGVIFPGKIQSL